MLVWQGLCPLTGSGAYLWAQRRESGEGNDLRKEQVLRVHFVPEDSVILIVYWVSCEEDVVIMIAEGLLSNLADVTEVSFVRPNEPELVLYLHAHMQQKDHCVLA